MRIAGFLKVRNGFLRDGELPVVVAHMRRLCDEVFACDDASYDGTLEYLQRVLGADHVVEVRAGAHGFERELQNKQRLLERIHAHGPWDFVLWLDSDELLDADASSGLCDFVRDAALQRDVAGWAPADYPQLWETTSWRRVDGEVGAACAEARLWRWRPDLHFDLRGRLGHLHQQVPVQIAGGPVEEMPFSLLHFGWTGQRRRLKLLEAAGTAGHGRARAALESAARGEAHFAPFDLRHIDGYDRSAIPDWLLGTHEQPPDTEAAARDVEAFPGAANGLPLPGRGALVRVDDAASASPALADARALLDARTERGDRAVSALVVVADAAPLMANAALRALARTGGRVFVLRYDEPRGPMAVDAALAFLREVTAGLVVDPNEDATTPTGGTQVEINAAASISAAAAVDTAPAIEAAAAHELAGLLGARSSKGAVRRRVRLIGDVPHAVRVEFRRTAAGVTEDGDPDDPLTSFVVGVAPGDVDGVAWRVVAAMRPGSAGAFAVLVRDAAAVEAALRDGAGTAGVVVTSVERARRSTFVVLHLSCPGAPSGHPPPGGAPWAGPVTPGTLQVRPRVCLVADVPNWAWARKARHLRRWLDDEFDVTVWLTVQSNDPPEGFDLYHTFDFPQVDRIMHRGARIVTGLTAHVWRTWGEDRVRRWAARAVALHANSRLLEREIREFHSRIYYTPNGVDPEEFKRTRPRDAEASRVLVVGHVGKPNPRKGAAIIEDACRIAGVRLKLNQRRYSDALSVEQMRDWYQDVHVLAVASDMDGTPNPALEGAACECAVLSTPIGNMPEFVVPGHNGFLVERSAAALADRLIWMRENVGAVCEMGRHARASVLAGWTWERQAEAYRTMWRECLALEPVA